jgi:hypothetical protein
MFLANSILLTFSPRKCVMVCTSGDYGTLSCPAFQILSMLPCWRSIMVVSQHFLPSLLLLMLSLRQALFPTFQLMLLLPFADLFRLYLTSPVLVVNSFEVFTDLFHRVSHSIGFYRHFGFEFSSFSPVLVSFPDSVWEPTWFSVVLLLGCTDGGCSVCP